MLDLEVRCAPPTKTSKSSWIFELTEEDEKKLRLNAVPMMKEICEIKVKYNFIYKSFDVAN